METCKILYEQCARTHEIVSNKINPIDSETVFTFFHFQTIVSNSLYCIPSKHSSMIDFMSLFSWWFLLPMQMWQSTLPNIFRSILWGKMRNKS